MILAGVSGVGLLIIVAAAIRWAVAGRDALDTTVFQWLGRFLLALICAYLYFMVVEWPRLGETAVPTWRRRSARSRRGAVLRFPNFPFERRAIA